ncbi:chromosome partitioning protein ParB [Halomonas sp. DX6]|uniref:Chromosome partitioning protein ParB n=2 Tax=Billgrantia bachuensis TaxID=2717286 RepID=A0ABX0PQJ8_9GAMM|nr:chromosome partitioning protein ParB [Halomonas bachuensis]
MNGESRGAGEAPLISSQRHLDREKVLRKARTFSVFVVRVHECTLRGRRYRMVIDGHHNLAAARVAGVEPRFKAPGSKFLRHLNKMTQRQRDEFLFNNLTDSEHYYVDTGEVVAELLPAETGGSL